MLVRIRRFKNTRRRMVMPDIIDNARRTEEKQRNALISRARRAIAVGVAGVCEDCDEYKPRLVAGVCAPCRDDALGVR